MTRYRYTVVHEGIVTADDERDAEGQALALADGGFALTTAVQVEAIRDGETHDSN